MSDKRVDIDVTGGLWVVVLVVFLLGTCDGGYAVRRVEKRTPDGTDTRWDLTPREATP